MKFKSKPVVIEAVQLTKELIADALLNNKSLPMQTEFRGRISGLTYDGTFHCRSRQGEVTADVDDWIIAESDGSGLCYPCKPDVFAAKYEPIASGAEPG